MGETRALQLAIALGGLVPVGAGLGGVMLGPVLAGDPGSADASLDSHFRYLSGLLLGLGLVSWSVIPHIARRTLAFRLITAVVVIGGLGRAYGLLAEPDPGSSMRAALVMELAVTPALCLWQARVARRATAATSSLAPTLQAGPEPPDSIRS